MINVNKTMADMAVMSDAQLKQTAVMNKTDPYMIALLSGESARRQAIRRGAQVGAQEQPTVVDQALARMDAGQGQAMPEDQGIAQLRTPNMETMAAAEGGIVGYADGGMVAFSKGGQSKDLLAQYEEQIRREAIRQGVDPDMAMRLFKAESGGRAGAVSEKGATGLGQLMVPAAAEMGLKPEERTDPSKNIPASIGYFKKQLNTFKDPEKALAAYNWGPGNVEKHLAKNEGQLNKSGLPKETADYINKILPVGTAYAAPDADAVRRAAALAQIPGQSTAAPAATGLAAADEARRAALVSQIPTGGTPGAGPTPPATPKETSFMGRQADKLGLSEDTQRNISNLSTALGGAMGAGYIPRYLPKVPGGLATLGERAYEIISPSKQMTPAQIEALRVANQGSRVTEAAQAAQMAGALPGEARSAAQAVEVANAAKLAALPSKAEQVQTAAMLRQAEEANRLAAAAKAVQYGGQAAAGSATADVATQPAATEGGIPDLAMGSKEDFRRKELQDQAKAESSIQVPAPAAAGEKPSWLTNDRALMLGLNLLAQQGKPGTGSAMRDLLGGLGTAGISTLASEKSDRASKAAEAYQASMGKKAEAEAAFITRGGKDKNEITLAEDLAQKRMKDWLSSSAGKLAGMDQAAQDAMLNRFRLDAYNQYGISMQPTATAAAPTSRQGWGAATVG